MEQIVKNNIKFYGQNASDLKAAKDLVLKETIEGD